MSILDVIYKERNKSGEVKSVQRGVWAQSFAATDVPKTKIQKEKKKIPFKFKSFHPKICWVEPAGELKVPPLPPDTSI